MSERWRSRAREAAAWLGLASCAAAVASIAISQSLLGLAVFSLLLSRTRWSWTPAWPALALFAGWTLLALAVSPEPAAGWPQVRKLYVLLGLPVAMVAMESLRRARILAVAWVTLGFCSAGWGIHQFARKWNAAQTSGEDFYLSYVAARITGFNSHWMTFSGQLMIALLAGLALLLWGGLARRWRLLLSAALAGIAAALVLAFTRGVWIATAFGAAYLLFRWRPWALAALPVAALVAVTAGPPALRERAASVVKPHGEVDSNSHRVATFRTGLRMVQAHPLSGVGPERVGRTFLDYAPREVLPLPEGYYAHLHNNFLHLAAERGTPAAAALLALFLWPLAVWRRSPPPPSGCWARRAAVASICALLAGGLFEYNLGDSEILMLALSALALGYRSAEWGQPAGPLTAPAPRETAS